MNRILRNGKLVEICKYDDQIFKLLFRTLKDFRLFGFYKKYGVDEIKEVCYHSRSSNVSHSETTFQNYLYWPYDLGSINHVQINISGSVKLFYSLVFAARIIENVLLCNSISPMAIGNGFFKSYFQRLSDFKSNHEQIVEDYHRLKTGIDFSYFLGEINNSVRTVRYKYHSYYKESPYSVNSYCSFLKAVYGIEI